ncbi:MAG: LysR family transcriptional regulator [Spirochaetaceae bacterium]|jgi:molybdate transport repressor ModE-like protein|nr:LysR family transcriptional regulator [Spirochaetaceae bacterium]
MNTSIPIQPRLRIMLVREKLFFGPGTFQLLQLIDETGSVQLACKRMGLSYSKAWKMLENMDEQLAFKVVERQQGGSHGGRSRITPKGRALMNRYRAFAAECQEEMLRIFSRYFPGRESPA